MSYQRTLGTPGNGTFAPVAGTGRHPLTGMFHTRGYGAVCDAGTDGTGTVDTTAIQNCITAACAVNGTVWHDGQSALDAALTFSAAFNLKGPSRLTSGFYQKTGTSDVFLKPSGTALGATRMTFEGLSFGAFGNTSNTGGLLLQSVSDSTVRYCRFSYTKNYSVKIVGGSSAQGDVMRNIIKENQFDSVRSGAGVVLAVGPDLTGPAAGSHADATSVIDNLFTYNTAGTTGILDAGPTTDAAGWLGTDSVVVRGNRFQEVAVPLDFVGQGWSVRDNRAEATGSGGISAIDVYVRAGTTNFPSLDNHFADNRWPTHGVPTNFTFHDSGLSTVRWGEAPKGGASGSIPIYEIVGASGSYVNQLRINGDTNPRFQLRTDGRMEWGPGNTATDTLFYRTSGPALRSEVEVSTLRGSVSSISYSSNIGGESGSRWRYRADGQFNIGPGDGTFDAGFYRPSAKVLAPANSGLWMEAQFTTAGRPSAATAGRGACYYDTTLSKPVWSDGTNWKDAAGTTV